MERGLGDFLFLIGRVWKRGLTRPCFRMRSEENMPAPRKSFWAIYFFPFCSLHGSCFEKDRASSSCPAVLQKAFVKPRVWLAMISAIRIHVLQRGGLAVKRPLDS